MTKTKKFKGLCKDLARYLDDSPVVTMNAWQGTSANPNALLMKELLHVHFKYEMPGTLDELRAEVEPFLPWADKHFEQERVSGQPINPGETYKEWRYPASAAEHTDFQFNHSYAERYWPQYAGTTPGGEVSLREVIEQHLKPHRGIRHSYGDLSTLVAVLARDSTTRQAYLPIFFPEDLTAARKGERVPCTLGYHFICRNGQLDVMYPMRSCDFVRHFRDDVYLTARLVFFVLEALQRTDPDTWKAIVPGRLVMQISSLHCFSVDKLN